MPSAGLARPEALPLLVAVALLAALALWSEARRARALAAFAGRSADLASVSARRRRVKLGLTVAAATLVVVALAGPYLDVVQRRVTQTGVDLVVALDVSQSMATRDVDPDRLRLGKDTIRELGAQLTQSRVSLVLFAGAGVLRYPATDDPTVLGGALDAVSPFFKPQGGSSLRSAVDSALLAFSEEARQSARAKAVILVTDGEDLSGQTPDLETLKQRGVRIFTVGVGTAQGGPIPTYDRGGKFLGYLKRANGEQIISRMDEPALKDLAARTGGSYLHVASPLRTAVELSTDLKRLDAAQLGDLEGGAVPDDRYQILLALALAALLADALITDRRQMPRPAWSRIGAARPRRRLPAFVRAATPWLATLVLLGGCSQVSSTDADQLYRSGDAAGALERYRALLARNAGVAELHVNTGNALHALSKYSDALGEYALALRDGSAHVRAVGQYQRGNTLFRMGKLDEAREAYKEALRIDPADRDAKFNIELIDRAVEVTEQRPGQSPPQPGQSARPGSGEPQNGSGEGDPSGTQQSGDASGKQRGDQGSNAPQKNGPPATDSDRTGPSVSDALRQFRSTLTADEALRLLDALMGEQRGLQQLIEGPPSTPSRPGQPPQDPTY